MGILCQWTGNACAESAQKVQKYVACASDDPNCLKGPSTSCFPSSAIVQLETGLKRRMDELRVGDSVLATNPDGSLVYSPISTFMHVERNLNASFVLLRHELGEIELSPDHLIFVSRNKFSKPIDVIADQVNLGDFVWTLQNEVLVPSQVLFIDEVYKQGVYSPLTEAGTLLVDGTLASSFIGFECTEDRPSRCQGGEHDMRTRIMKYLSWALKPLGILPVVPYGELPLQDIVPSKLTLSLLGWMRETSLLG